MSAMVCAKESATCVICGKPFERQPCTAHRLRVTCSVNCRYKLLRRRRKASHMAGETVCEGRRVGGQK